MILEHEVDDTRDGVRTIHRGVAAGDNVDAVDQVGRNGVDIDADARVQDVAADVTAAVDQHQRALRSQTAKIEKVKAAGAQEARRVRLRERARDLRQLGELVADRDIAGLEEFLPTNGGHRQRRGQVRRADARARHDDGVRRGRSAICRKRLSIRDFATVLTGLHPLFGRQRCGGEVSALVCWATGRMAASAANETDERMNGLTRRIARIPSKVRMYGFIPGGLVLESS